MFKLKMFLIYFASLFMITSGANADGLYLAAGFTNSKGKESAVEYTSTNTIILAGYDLNDFFGLEAEISSVLTKDTVTKNSVNLKVGKSHSAAFIKAAYPLSSDFSIHARIGQSNGKASASAGGVVISLDKSTTAYGFGTTFAASDNLSIRADYTVADYGSTDGTILALIAVFKF